MSDFYQILGVSKNATEDEIKKAYKKLALQYHPDRNKDPKAVEKFKEITESYNVLSDKSKRQQYDMMGSSGFGGFNQAGFGSSSSQFGFDFEDLFNAFTGANSFNHQGQARGADLQLSIQLTLEEIFEGCVKKVSIKKYHECENCSGTGSADSKVHTCSKCSGKGYSVQGAGFLQIQRACSTCKGSGKQIPLACAKCAGQGRMRKNIEVQINVPKGVDNGQDLRLVGQGDAGAGGRSGDLYVKVSVFAHNIFERKGLDLYCDLHINIDTAILGGVVQVPTIERKPIDITIPAATQPGAVLRVKGKGLVRNGVIGDMYCVVKVEIPKVKNTQVWKEFFTTHLVPDKNSKQTSWLNTIRNYFNI